MFELVAGLTVIFAGYVLYEVFKTVSETNQRPPVTGAAPEPAQPIPESTTAVTDTVEEAAAAPAAVPLAETPDEPVPPAAEPAPTAPVVEASAEKLAATLRNPVTGETCAVPTNYRFAKKWVKDALVAEGLLDKVYKAADLDEAGSQKVKEALERLKTIVKYMG